MAGDSDSSGGNGLRVSWPSLTEIMRRYGPWPMLAIGLVTVVVFLLVRLVDFSTELNAQVEVDKAQTAAINAIGQQMASAAAVMHDAVIRREQREAQRDEDTRRLLESIRQLGYETCLLATDGRAGRDRCLNAYWREGGPNRR